jgi:hypothetical protein
MSQHVLNINQHDPTAVPLHLPHNATLCLKLQLTQQNTCALIPFMQAPEARPATKPE